MVLSGLIETAPFAPCVTELIFNVSPSGSVSLASTLMSTGVSSSVVAESLFAIRAASCVIAGCHDQESVSKPLRAEPVVFGATVKFTVPLLLPLAPESIVMKELLLTAFQSCAAAEVPRHRYAAGVTCEKNAWLAATLSRTMLGL